MKTFSGTSKKVMTIVCGLLFMLSLAGPGRILAATITVNSIAALQTAINNAAPGDVIILANGVYTTSGDIAVNKAGTAAQPITIAAQTIGGVEITGSGGFSIVSPAAYIIIKGFKFTHSASHAKMGSGTRFCRWTRNIFETPGTGENLLLNGNDHEVDYNTFQNKNALGRFIAVRGSGSQVAERLWIHHNYFFKQLPQTGNGAETVQFGLSGYSLSSSNSVMEYNLFEECAGENEMISIKASAVTLRYNTIRNCPAQFTLRHGNRCQVYGNYFINTPGLRIFGDDHIIYSNYFENCSPAINVGNGDGEVADGAALTSHDRPDRVLIAFNTLVNNTSNITQSGRTGGLGATFITVTNNIIQGGGPAASIAGPYTDSQWQGNIIFNTNGPGAMPLTGYRIVDPKLAKDPTGTFHLQPGSPAIDSAGGSYPSIMADMDGQPRTSPLDKGADEVSSAPVVARILTTAMVGHNAVASDKPSVGLTSPRNKSIFDAGTNISIAADAISFDGSITKVEFYVDGLKIGEDEITPYAFNWTASEGTHTLTAKATDDKEEESISAAVGVTINPPGFHIKIVSPMAGTTVAAPADITIDVTASDSLYAITKVEFFRDTSKLGEDTTSPYSFIWSGVAAGNYALQTKATNTLEKKSVSSPVNIAVTAATNPSFDITDNGGVITAQYANTSKPTENFPSVIDNKTSTKYYQSGRKALWIQYQSTIPAVVVKYTITSANDVPERDPKDWSLQASNDGTAWTTLDMRTGEIFPTRFLTKTYSFQNGTSYLYYRLNIISNNGHTGTQLAEWELYQRKTQLIAVNDISDMTYGDDPVVLSATASSGLPVTFEVLDGPGAIDSTQLTMTGAGTITVRAIQAGDEKYFPAIVDKIVTVNKATQTIIFDVIGSKTFGDDPFVLSATADSGLPVAFEVVSGPASIQDSILTITGAGSITMQAIQEGDTNYESTSVEQTFIVHKALQIITFMAVDTKTFGDTPFTLHASVPSGLPIVFDVISGPATLSDSTLTITGAGTVTVGAGQNGNENYDQALAEQNFVVQKASQIITFEAVPPKTIHDVVALSAISSSGLTVLFDIISGPGVLAGNSLSFNDEGIVVVEASQSGNENYLAAAATEQTVVVDGQHFWKDKIRIIVAPNPTHGKVVVLILDLHKDKHFTFSVYDHNGNPVQFPVNFKHAKLAEVDLSSGADGLYYLLITDGTASSVTRIVKK